MVDGTVGKNREDQGKVLTEKGLVFSHPIDQALAAAAFACMRGGKDLFGDKIVRGSVPGFVLCTIQIGGVRVLRYVDSACDVPASGSPSPESKIT
jgi:hypothetical protein